MFSVKSRPGINTHASLDGEDGRILASILLYRRCCKVCHRVSAELEKANHPKGWDAKPLA